eukprot:689123-Pelagomonas_calceolata.AAC.1
MAWSLSLDAVEYPLSIGAFPFIPGHVPGHSSNKPQATAAKQASGSGAANAHHSSPRPIPPISMQPKHSLALSPPSSHFLGNGFWGMLSCS